MGAIGMGWQVGKVQDDDGALLWAIQGFGVTDGVSDDEPSSQLVVDFASDEDGESQCHRLAILVSDYLNSIHDSRSR